MKNAPRKVLLLGMIDSVHIGRWLKSASVESNLDILIVPTSPHRRIHADIRNLEKSRNQGDFSLRIHPFLRFTSIFVWLLDRPFLFSDRIRAWFIRRTIESFQPDLVHIMETQNGGYPYLAYASSHVAIESKRKYKLALTLFGSDLYWFARFETHKKRLEDLLALVDVISAECSRDIDLSRELGFTGKVAKLAPVSGGLSRAQISAPDNDVHFAARNIIAIKGYGGTWGLGHVAIKAVAQNYEFLGDLKVVIFSAESKARRAAKKYLRPLKIEYSLFPKFALSHKEMLALYKKSLIYIGLSKSDGLPASMLEAMSQGAFPVQTSSACTDGWFEPGETGKLVDVNNIEEIQVRLADILKNRAKIRNAQTTNLKMIQSRYSTSTISSQITYGFLLKS